MPEERQKNILEEISFKDFVETFLYMWDYDTGGYGPVRLWPEQERLCGILQSNRKLFWGKARQVGGSVLAGFYAVYVAITEPRSEILIISVNEDEARKFFEQQVKVIFDQLPIISGLDWPSVYPKTTELTLSNGSKIISMTSHPNAGRGRTSRLIIMDEAGIIEHAASIWKAAMPAIEQNPKGQILVISNACHGSWFNEMYKKIMDGKAKGVNRYFLSAWADPKRDQNWYNETMTQYVSEIDFFTDYPLTEDQMFLQKEGKVIPNFIASEGGRHVYKFEPNWNNKLIYGYDDGYIHYSVFLIMLYDDISDKLFVLDESYCINKDTEQICKAINEKVSFWQALGMPLEAWRKIADTAIFAQKGQKPVSELIKFYTGIQFSKSYKYNEDSSLQLIRVRCNNDKIIIHPRCKELRRQLDGWRYGKNGEPEDKENDGPDVVKYVVAELKKEDPELILPSPEPFHKRFSRETIERLYEGKVSHPLQSMWREDSWLAH